MLGVSMPKGFSAEVLRVLLAQGVPPNYQSPSGDSALQYAVEMKNDVAVLLLLKAGASPSKKVLEQAASKSYPNESIARALAAASAPP